MNAVSSLQALWGVVSAESSAIEWGHLEYTLQRLSQYYLLKERFLASNPSFRERAAQTGA